MMSFYFIAPSLSCLLLEEFLACFIMFLLFLSLWGLILTDLGFCSVHFLRFFLEVFIFLLFNLKLFFLFNLLLSPLFLFVLMQLLQHFLVSLIFFFLQLHLFPQTSLCFFILQQLQFHVCSQSRNVISLIVSFTSLVKGTFLFLALCFF